MSFQFKRFKIQHHDLVFKFGTDAALLATWVHLKGTKNVLEIGTGSGVITLMMAQRSPDSVFTGIDISKDAIALANSNLIEFPIPSNVTFVHSALQDYNPDQKFDLIVSNPPFFENATKSPSELKNATRHTDILPLRDLLEVSMLALTENGKIEIVYPSRYLADIETHAKELGLYINHISYTRATPQKPIKRVLISLSKNHHTPIIKEIVINGDYSGYSKAIYELFKPFYLKL